MGDASFLKMLGEVCQTYRYQTITAEQFEAIAARYLPKGYAEAFFDHWVENTGIPAIEMTQAYKAGKLLVKVTQTEVSDTVSLHVPVEVQVARGRSQTHWVTTGPDPVSLTVPLKVAPLKVTLDPEAAVLRR